MESNSRGCVIADDEDNEGNEDGQCLFGTRAHLTPESGIMGRSSRTQGSRAKTVEEGRGD
jgi:hypothetical protein